MDCYGKTGNTITDQKLEHFRLKSLSIGRITPQRNTLMQVGYWRYSILICIAKSRTTLAFFLYDGDYRNQGSEKPFACIAFEDIERLRTRITECIPSDWDITNWNIPPLSDTEYWKRHIDFDNNGFSTEGAWNPANGGMIQNCWHIPLRRLLDIATVTMIGESDPRIGAWTAEQYDLQKERLEYIKSYAWGIDQNMNWKERRITEDQIRRDLEEAHGRTRFKWGELFYTDIREFRRAQADCLRKRTRNQIVLCTP